MAKTLYITHPTSFDHITPEGHPERLERLHAITDKLSAEPLAYLTHNEAPCATDDMLTMVHSQTLVDDLQERLPANNITYIDGDTTMSPGSWQAALHAVGGACYAVDQVILDKVDNAFCAHRPPGHHAETHRAMGFCLLNTAAIAARYVQKMHGAERVAIIDFDVHHGNGTQEIFYQDPTVFYGSTHQMPLFPGTGSKIETGVGNIANAPLSSGDGSIAFRDAMQSVVLKQLQFFEPDFIIISAGFDAHHLDPLANIHLDENDFSWITEQIMAIAGQFCYGRIISVLEGGYHLEGLSNSVHAHIKTLQGG